MQVMDATTVNRILELRVKDLAGRPHERSAAERKAILQRALGLEPLPPRTPLNAQVTGEVLRDGYRIDKVSYESRPGFLVTANLYLPLADGPFPVVLRPHGHVPGKKAAPISQASAIGLALSGFAVFVIDSPGHSGDTGPENERAGQGSHRDFFLAMGAPLFGTYVWDVMRGLDYLETRPDCDTKRVGITGESGGGQATIYAYAMDERIQTAVSVCAPGAIEIQPNNGCPCNHVPGLLEVGDRAEVLGIRASDGAVMILGAEEDAEFPPDAHRRTEEKLRKLFRSGRGEHRVRSEIFPYGHDYNRRMREAALAFFREHLLGEPSRPYAPEPIPLTDGGLNPAPANTVPFDAPELWARSPEDRSTRTLRDLLDLALVEAYPQPFDAMARLVPWGRYGKLWELRPGGILSLHDAELTPAEPESIPLPHQEIEVRYAMYLGLSVAEVYAQLIHLTLPGAPAGWEERGLAGDALTSLVASMKTLVASPSGPPPGLVIAQGPFAGWVAYYLAKLRPDLTIRATHPPTAWSDALRLNLESVIQPGARYLAF